MNTTTTPRPEVTADGATHAPQHAQRTRQALGLRRGLGYGPRSETHIARDGR